VGDDVTAAAGAAAGAVVATAAVVSADGESPFPLI